MLYSSAIAEGDTRETGLDRLLSSNEVNVVRAVSSKNWPGSASVTYSIVWTQHSPWKGMAVLDDVKVKGINSYLSVPGNVVGPPKQLAANRDKIFQGSIVVGKGFVLTAEQAQELISLDKKNSNVVVPYLTGAELNSHPRQLPSKWAVNFFDWPLDRDGVDDYDGPVAKDFPAALKIIEEKVKPSRQRKKKDRDGNEVFALRKPLPEKWWIYGDKRPALYKAVKEYPLVVGNARAATKYLSFAILPKGMVYSDALTVAVLNNFGQFAALSSTIHDVWSREHASMNLSLLRYVSSDCFDTFPFPTLTGELTAAGEAYNTYRSELMIQTELGLTRTYNRFNDETDRKRDIADFRSLHQQMDEAVVAAYGWNDLKCDHGFYETKHGKRFTINGHARTDLLQRLLKLNHERYSIEIENGMHSKSKQKTAPRKRRSAKKKAAAGLLFGDDEG